MKDFLGFSFNNIHSSSLGITRVSKGGLLNQPFLPSGKDLIDSGVDRDESYYYGSKNNTLTFSIDYIYGPIDESSFLRLKQFCKTKGISELIFDELLHKKYMAKITGSAVSYYNVYDLNNERKYKGEGSLTFTCYFPYGLGRYKYIEEIFSEKPTWESGKIVNIGDSFKSAILIGEETMFEELQKLIGTINLKNARYDDLNAKISVTALETPPDGLIIQNKMLEQISYSGLVSKWDYGIRIDKDGSGLIVNNIGDVKMPFTFSTDHLGELSIALDGEIVQTVKKRSPKLVRLDSVNKIFLDGITGKITNECEVLYGDFIEIPPGEHRISIVINGKHVWNSYLIKDMEFQYIYY